MAEMLGLAPAWTQVNGLGGASTIAGVARAASAIRDRVDESQWLRETTAVESTVAR
jgi:hypothetical protein